jgi:hypothetical protein
MDEKKALLFSSIVIPETAPAVIRDLQNVASAIRFLLAQE